MEAIGIDLGECTSKVCRWNSDPHSTLGEGPYIVESEQGNKYFASRLCFREKMFDVCGQRKFSVERNIANCIWGYKPIVGSSSKSAEMKPAKAKEGKQRSYYNVQFDSKDRTIDAELATSLVLQYLYYLFLRNDDITFTTYPFKLSKVLTTSRQVVIAIPEYYTKSNIRGLEVALSLANLGQASFLRESIAVALDYGYCKAENHEFPAQGSTILFCDMGSHCTTVTIVRFFNDRMEVLKSASCFLGGDAFDEALGALVERKLREQEDVELPSTEAIAYRLKLKGEEIKKAFATEQGQSISVEFVQGDDCFDLEIAREEFEAACRDRRLFDRFFEFVSDVLRDFPAALRLDGIETVGGNMYIARLGRELLHAVQDRGLEVQKVGSTMSKQEACARGCALFARKALVEKKIVCGAVDVLVNDPQNDVKLTMPLFGCRSDTVRRGDFAIVTEDAPQGGYDHDWSAILHEGVAFIKDFESVCEESNSTEEVIDKLQKSVHMLQSLLETAQDRAEHRARAEQDMQFLREKERLSSSTRGVPFATLLESQRSVQDCVEQWERRLSHRTEERKVGALVYRGEWRDGQRFGVHYGYNEQEQLEVVAQFEADKLNGKKRTLDPDSGALLEVAEYKNDQLHGKYRSYYASKELKEVCMYVHGQKEGACRKYYENRQLSEVCSYKNGAVEDYFALFYKNGQLKREGVVKNGRKVFVNCFHANGTIQTQLLFDAAGEIRAAFEFDKDGDLVYAGNHTRDGKRQGPSLLFYCNRFYAHCTFRQGEMVLRGAVVPAEQYDPRKLDRDFALGGALDTRFISWRPVEESEVSTGDKDVVVWSFDDTDHPVLTTTYTTPYDEYRDLLRPKKEGKERELSAEEQEEQEEQRRQKRLAELARLKEEKKLAELMGRLRYPDKLDTLRMKRNTLFGDLVWQVDVSYDESEKSMTWTEFYPTGVHEAALEKPELCRKRLVRTGFLEHDADSECEAVLYYNNGAKKRVGKMKGSKWVEYKEYLNTGIEVKEDSVWSVC